MSATGSPNVDGVIDVLRGAGQRITTAKRALAAALLAADGHRTAEQLVSEIQARHPDVHEATVYRNLHALEQLRVVEHVHLGHGPAVYHLAANAHHHLVCDSCGGVEELPDRTLAPLIRKLHSEYGFAADSRHFAISGRCRSCIGSPSPA